MDFPSREKLEELAIQSMRLGFNMGVTSIRLKMMEAFTPYIDKEILGSDLLTTRDIIELALYTLQDFEADPEFEKMREVMKGLGSKDIM